MSRLAKLPPRLPTQQQRVAAPSISASTGSAERQRLYRTARWLRLRLEQLQEHPLCALCEREGRVTAAEVADHRDGHMGNWRARFFDMEGLQSLCLDHHRIKSGNEYAEWLQENG
jgi:5-methylcytosine-specific restriction enzyme A